MNNLTEGMQFKNLYHFEERMICNYSAKEIDIEKYAMSRLEFYGYKPYKTKDFGKFEQDIFNGKIKSSLPFYNALKFAISDNIGRPDLFAIKNDKVIFIEVKSTNDSVRSTQLQWFRRNWLIPIIIFVIKEKKK